jgi:hypothetical protein
MGALISKVFPCMAVSIPDDGSSQPDSIVVNIKSNSACCRGKTVQLKLDNSQIGDLSKIMAEILNTNKNNK